MEERPSEEWEEITPLLEGEWKRSGVSCMLTAVPPMDHNQQSQIMIIMNDTSHLNH
jgi:hypothetical protein